MIIKIGLRKFSNSKYVHNDQIASKGSFSPLIKFGNFNQNIIEIPTIKQKKKKKEMILETKINYLKNKLCQYLIKHQVLT